MTWVKSAVLSPTAIFDRLHTRRHRDMIERSVVALSVVGFLAHLGMIFLARTLRAPPPVIASAGHDYFSAIATPFNFVLFYEVLMLIAAIPASTTHSIAQQYEIVSLIFVRGFFKDLAEVDLDALKSPFTELTPAIQDVAAGLVMFLLVTIFRHASQRPGAPARSMTPALEHFIGRKKAIALLLIVVFLGLAAHDTFLFFKEFAAGSPATFHESTTFYTDVFTVMIYTDVLILLFSLLVYDAYELVFRNAAFVISTILIRTSLTVGHPFGAEVGVAGMIFGILTILIYKYDSRVNSAK